MHFAKCLCKKMFRMEWNHNVITSCNIRPCNLPTNTSPQISNDFSLIRMLVHCSVSKFEVFFCYDLTWFSQQTISLFDFKKTTNHFCEKLSCKYEQAFIAYIWYEGVEELFLDWVLAFSNPSQESFSCRKKHQQ